jgi:hypothetical protein
MDHATIDRALDRNFRALMLDPVARQAMCQASRDGIRIAWPARTDDPYTYRTVLRFHLLVLRLGRKLAD